MTNIIDYLNYDPASGIFTWGQSRSRIKEGEIAGCLSRNGYWKIKFDRKNYFAHRLAWYVYYGEWPKGQIDHINRDKLDNRIENLRDVDRKTNCQNRNSFNGGATYHILNKKWQSQIKIDNRNHYLGSYETKEEAQFAFEKAIKEYYERIRIPN